MKKVILDLDNHFTPFLTTLAIENLFFVFILLRLPIRKHLFKVHLCIVTKIHPDVSLCVCMNLPLPLVHIQQIAV